MLVLISWLSGPILGLFVLNPMQGQRSLVWIGRIEDLKLFKNDWKEHTQKKVNLSKSVGCVPSGISTHDLI